MSKTKFEYFHNHGDEDGNNSLTVCFGDSDEPDHIIVTCEDTEEDATEVVKRLNEIINQHAQQAVNEYKEKLKAEIRHVRSKSNFEISGGVIIQMIDRL